MTVRAFFRSLKVENSNSPDDTLILKVLYPATISTGDTQNFSGLMPADSQQAPFPVVIFFSGFNCEPILYQWLTVQLASRGLVVVTFAWVAEYLPGAVGLTPGVNMAMLTPATYGTGATASALPALLGELDRLQAEGILAGMLDLQKIILGGHSGGGRISMESANPQFCSQVVAAFSYGAHSAAPTMLGFEADTILPLPSSLPMLIIGGTRDGVIASNNAVYGMKNPTATTSVVRTFNDAINGGKNDKYLLLIEGANHFSIAYPKDNTVGTLVDLTATQPEENIRSLLAETIGLFIDAHVRHKPEALTALENMLNSDNPLIATFERK